MKFFKYINAKNIINTKKIYFDLKLYEISSKISYTNLIKNKE